MAERLTMKDDIEIIMETQQYNLSKVLTDQDRTFFVLKNGNTSIFKIEVRTRWFLNKKNIHTSYDRLTFPFGNDYIALGYALAYLEKNYET